MVDLVNSYQFGKKKWAKCYGRYFMKLIYKMGDTNVLQIQILAMRTLNEK